LDLFFLWNTALTTENNSEQLNIIPYATKILLIKDWKEELPTLMKVVQYTSTGRTTIKMRLITNIFLFVMAF
jgi:hypothetical protein